MKVCLARKQAARFILQQRKAALQHLLGIQQAQAAGATQQALAVLVDLQVAGGLPALLQGVQLCGLMLQGLAQALLQGLRGALQLQGVLPMPGLAHGRLQQAGAQMVQMLGALQHFGSPQLLYAQSQLVQMQPMLAHGAGTAAQPPGQPIQLLGVGIQLALYALTQMQRVAVRLLPHIQLG